MNLAYRIFLASGLFGVVLTAQAAAFPTSLRNVPIPPVPGLLDGSSPIVVNKDAAIALGKALFWDQAVGSDGQACASCHFHAGADSRVKNQINPGQLSSQRSGLAFDALPSGSGGPNHELSLNDFPLHRFSNPLDNTSAMTFDTDDVVSSAGTFGGEFVGSSKFTGVNDLCNRSADELFNVAHVGTRRVEPRNTPTVINAVFNHRNFWDGRANNVFNGSSPWGPRDQNAGVWVKQNAKTVTKQRLNLINSSLASQAVAPPVFNNIEMGCSGRYWPDIGRKLLNRQPLQNQQVHAQDSVLGALSLSSANELKPGLKTTYRNLITQAFNAKYWSYSGIGGFGAPTNGAPYNQMEANFSMFFGLALQLYQSTLVSDQSPFDQSPVNANLTPTWSNISDPALRASLSNGYSLFTGQNCGSCHIGPTTSLAAIETNATLLTPTPGATYGPADSPIAYGPNAFGTTSLAATIGATRYGSPVTRDLNAAGVPGLQDLGFVNLGVSKPESDPGVGGEDDFGNPLSYSAQYVEYLVGNSAGIYDLPVGKVRACDFPIPLAVNLSVITNSYFTRRDSLEVDGSREGVPRNQGCAISTRAYIPTVAAAVAARDTVKMATQVNGAFKVPGIRNVELTGPYMHDGSLATLEQVVEFYARHGNFSPSGTHNLLGIIASGISPGQNTTDLVNFMKALTDERVRYERAPFDHPQLNIAHGHVGDDAQAVAGHPLSPALAQDQQLQLPAVGATGSDTPIEPFLAQ
ncbi:MAG: cytochrome c peroxidase [Methylomonas sp.]|nr:cytochrome c peroxidase [Methylomonas sp.]